MVQSFDSKYLKIINIFLGTEGLDVKVFRPIKYMEKNNKANFSNLNHKFASINSAAAVYKFSKYDNFNNVMNEVNTNGDIKEEDRSRTRILFKPQIHKIKLEDFSEQPMAKSRNKIMFCFYNKQHG